LKRLRSSLFVAGLAALVLFTALMAVIAIDYNTPGDMAPGTAIAIGAGVVVSAALILTALFRNKGTANGRA
jgi:hypothetical protein